MSIESLFGKISEMIILTLIKYMDVVEGDKLICNLAKQNNLIEKREIIIMK